MSSRCCLLLLALGAACQHGPCHEDRGARVSPTRTLTIEQFEATVLAAGPRATFRETTATEHEAVARLVPALLEATSSRTPPATPARWETEAAALGLRIEPWTVGGEHYWALVEVTGRQRGAGAYVFRVAPRPRDQEAILLQAPHSFYDVGTGRLAADLFFTRRPGARPDALFTNTMHRYQLAPGRKQRRRHSPADVAHNAEHAFTVATEAFTIAAGRTRVIQLHGFGARLDDDDGDDGDPGALAMVVSAGDRAGSSPLSTAVAAAATRVFGPGVKRFPEDTKLLGATTNAQKRMLEKSRRGDFLHIEMSSDLRARLAASAALRAQLADVLFDSHPEQP